MVWYSWQGALVLEFMAVFWWVFIVQASAWVCLHEPTQTGNFIDLCGQVSFDFDCCNYADSCNSLYKALV